MEDSPVDFRVNDYVDFFDGIWSVRVVKEVLPQQTLRVGTSRDSSHSDKTIILPFSSISPFRSYTQGRLSYALPYSYRTKISNIISQIETVEVEIARPLQEFIQPREIIQLLRGRHYFLLDSLFAVVLESEQQKRVCQVYFDMHLDFLLRYLAQLDFTDYCHYNRIEIYSSRQKALCSCFPELLELLGNLIEPDKLKRDNMKYLSHYQPVTQQWVEKKFISTVAALVHRSEGLPIKFLVMMFEIIVKMAKKQVVSKSEQLACLCQSLYQALLREMHRQLRDRKELDGFISEIEFIFKLFHKNTPVKWEPKQIEPQSGMPHSSPTSLSPQARPAASYSQSTFSYSTPRYCPSQFDVNIIPKIQFRIELIEAQRKNGKEFITDFSELMLTLSIQATESSEKVKVILDYVREKDIISEILKKDSSLDLTRMSILRLVRFMEREVISLVIKHNKIGLYGKHIVNKLPSTSLPTLLELVETKRKQVSLEMLSKAESSMKTQPLARDPSAKIESSVKIESSMKTQLGKTQLGKTEGKEFTQTPKQYICSPMSEFIELYKHIETISLECSMGVRRTCQRLILEIGDIPELEYCLRMYLEPQRQQILLAYIDTIPPVHSLFQECLLASYYTKKKYQPNLQRFTLLVRELLTMDCAESIIEKRKTLVGTVLTQVFEDDPSLYLEYLEAYLTVYAEDRKPSRGLKLYGNFEKSGEALMDAVKSADYCDRNIRRLLPLQQDFQVCLFGLLMKKYNQLLGNITSAGKVVAHPLFMLDLFECIPKLSCKDKGAPNSPLLKSVLLFVESLISGAEKAVYNKLLIEFVGYFLKHCPTSSCVWVTVQKIRTRNNLAQKAKSGVKEMMRVQLVNKTGLQLVHAKKVPLDQFHHYLREEQIRKCTQECVVNNLTDTVDFLKIKIAMLFAKEFDEITLYYKDAPVTSEQLAMKCGDFFADPHPDKTSYRLEFTFPIKCDQPQDILTDYLYSQSECIWSHLPHTAPLFRMLSPKYSHLNAIMQTAVCTQTLPEVTNYAPALNLMLDYFIDHPSSDYGFLVHLLRGSKKEEEVKKNYKILYLLYRSGWDSSGMREELLRCLAIPQSQSEEEKERDLGESDWYAHFSALVFASLLRYPAHLLRFCLDYSICKYFSDCKQFALKFLQFWKLVYSCQSLQAKTAFLDRIQTHLSSPNMYFFFRILPDCFTDEEKPLYSALGKKVVTLLRDCRQLYAHETRKVFSILLAILSTLLEKGIKILEIQTKEFMQFFFHIIYEVNFESRDAIIKVFFFLNEREERRRDVYKFFRGEIAQSQWEQRQVFYRMKPRYHQEAGLVGLRNPHSICYANSLFQQLFHIKEFREHLLLAEWKPNGPPAEDLMLQMKKIMLNLLEQTEPYINYDFFKAFKGPEGEETEINMQMDVDQFRFVLLDRLQKILPPQNNFIKKLFNGKQSTVVRSLECEHTSSRTQTEFSALCLEVKGFANLQESVNAYSKSQILEGENAYVCDQCAKKVKASKHIQIDEYPEYLTFALKRFEYLIFRRQKINSRFEFPLQTYEPVNGVCYRLRGVIIHQGVSEAGHYVSLIRQGDSWYDFNDSYVAQIPKEMLEELTFGGDMKIANNSKNAYLLFYEKNANSREEKVLFVSEEQKEEAYSRYVGMQQEWQTIKHAQHLVSKENIYLDSQFLKLINLFCEKNSEVEAFLLLIETLITISFKQSDEVSRLMVKDSVRILAAHRKVLRSVSVQQFERISLKIFDFINRQPVSVEKSVLVQLLVCAHPVSPASTEFLLEYCLSRIRVETANTHLYYQLLQGLCERDEIILQSVVRQRIFSIAIGSFMLHEDKDYRDEKNKTYYDRLKKDLDKGEFKYHKWKFLVYLLKHKGYDSEQYNAFSVINSQIVRNIFEEANSKPTLNYVARYFAMLSTENEDYTHELIPILQELMLKDTGDNCRKYARVMKELAAIEDSLQEERVTKIFGIFVKTLHKNLHTWQPILDYTWQWFNKIALKNKVFRATIKEHSRSLDFMDKLTHYDLHYIKDLYRVDRSKNVYHGLKFPNNAEQLQEQFKSQMKTTKELLRDSLPWIGDETIDSDGDITEIELEPSLSIMRYHSKDEKYKEVTVRVAMGDYLLLSSSKEDCSVYSRGSNKLAPYMALPEEEQYSNSDSPSMSLST